MNGPIYLSAKPPPASPVDRTSFRNAKTGWALIFPPSVRTACTTLVLLFGLQVSLAFADDHPETDDAASMTRAELEEHPERMPTGSCVCLSDPATGNFTKNCLVQHRDGEATPQFFCSDQDGVMTNRTVPLTWLIVPGDHPDCQPCDEAPPITAPDVPRN